ncbi:hypothetical protein [Streptomyces olivaceus]
MADALFDLPAPTENQAAYGLPPYAIRYLTHRDDFMIGLFIEACDWLTLRTLDARITRACQALGVPVPPAVAARQQRGSS